MEKQYSSRLFHKIIINHEPSIPLYYWLDVYKENGAKALNEILQLCMDACGYQHVEIGTDLSPKGFKRLILKMDEELSPALMEAKGKYYLKNNKKTDQLSTFIISFVQLLHSNDLLYQTDIFRQLLKFSIKCKTALLTILNRNANTTNIQTPDKSKLSSEHTLGNQIIQYIDENIYNDNWLHVDHKLRVMKEQCVAEIKEWMILSPQNHLTDEWLLRLMTATRDQSPIIRECALNTFMYAIQDDIPDGIQIYKYLDALEGRVYDVKYNIAVLAVEILRFIDRSYMSLPEQMRDRLLTKIYCHHTELAAACGQYLIQLVKKQSKDHTEIIINLVNFQLQIQEKNNKLRGKTELLVESVIDNVPALQNASVYVQILEQMNREEPNDDFNKILLKILNEATRITLFNKPSYIREAWVQNYVNYEQTEAMESSLRASLRSLSRFYNISQMSTLVKYLVMFHTNIKRARVEGTNVSN